MLVCIDVPMYISILYFLSSVVMFFIYFRNHFLVLLTVNSVSGKRQLVYCVTCIYWILLLLYMMALTLNSF